jgi:4-hydroxybenzoate polyprenyltransferase
MARKPVPRHRARERPPQRQRRELIPMPRRPYRDSALFHLVLGALLLLVAWLTGGNLVRAIVIAVAYVVIAIAWSWWRFRQRLEREASTEAGASPSQNGRVP